MPGPHVTSQQKRLFMDFRRQHLQPVAAAKAGFSERTGRRVESAHHLPALEDSKPRLRRRTADGGVAMSVELPDEHLRLGDVCSG